MGSCIICGTSTDGEVCDVHQEDVGFVFEGSSPDELTPNRYYRGTVDGYADFGVFVDIGDAVTGLLHQSELDQRLDSLSWEPGDEVFVQVDGVRDNGNVDLTWSIRQDASEFRGLLIDAPDGERRAEEESEDGATGSGGPDAARSGGGASGNEHSRQRQSDGGRTTADAAGVDGEATSPEADAESAATDASNADAGARAVATPTTEDAAPETVEDTHTEQVDDAADPTEDAPERTDESPDPADNPSAEIEDVAVGSVDTVSEGGAKSVQSEAVPSDASDLEDVAPGESAPGPEETPIDALEDAVGDVVQIDGEVVGIQQTGGPTIFELRDGTGTVDCAAFDGAGVRAYPEVEVGDYVRLAGAVERRRGDLQVETETLLVLTGEDRDAVAAAIDDAIEDAVRPEEATFAAEADPAEPLAEEIVAAATAIRRAIAAERPVVIRHPATADGHAAGAALERGGFARARSEAEGAEPDYHAIHRRPLDEPLYGMDATTSDLTRMLQDRERHGEQLPLLVLVGLGASAEAVEAVELLDVYGVDRVVLDTAEPDQGAETVGDPVVNPHFADIETALSNSALASAVGATVAPTVRNDLAHVPAIGYWEEPPAAYEAAADAAGVDADQRRAIREALALEAHYQGYNDKRELVEDVLFGEATELAGHVAEQFREKLETEVATARENLVVRDTGGVRFAVLDTDAFTHRFDFPPTTLLLDELHRREREEAEGAAVTIGAGEEELYVRSTEPIDVREIAAEAAVDVPGVAAVGGADGHVEYLPGDRDEAIEAVVAALASGIEA